MQNGLQSEIDKALGLTSPPPPPPPEPPGKIAQVRQTAALQAEIQSLQARQAHLEKTLEALSSLHKASRSVRSQAKSEAAGLLRRLAAVESATINQAKSQASQARALQRLTQASLQTRKRLQVLTIAVAVLAALTIVSILL